MQRVFKVIGLMSGTSVDGLDIAFCRFEKEDNAWNFDIIHADTLAYEEVLGEKLKSVAELSKKEIDELDLVLGDQFATAVNEFIRKHEISPDFIASHGHTVFHQPEKGFTLQIGNGEILARKTNMEVINDFRSQDVELGGQGAPLVPIGDQLLFGRFAACLNLGGIANVSFQNGPSRIAYDVCPVNMPLNYVANLLGLEYDNEGKVARSGEVIYDLLDQLNGLDFYTAAPPKSLGYEWVYEKIIPLVRAYDNKADILATLCEHTSMMVGKELQLANIEGNVLCTGGGAMNTYLMDRIKFHCQEKLSIYIPDSRLISYKESLVFAFLGVLRKLGEVNVLASVTGAKHDHSSGVIISNN